MTTPTLTPAIPATVAATTDPRITFESHSDRLVVRFEDTVMGEIHGTTAQVAQIARDLPRRDWTQRPERPIGPPTKKKNREPSGHQAAVRKVRAIAAERDLIESPALVSLWPTAGEAVGLGRRSTYTLAQAGKFPVEVLAVGGFLRCRRRDLLAFLGIEG